MSSRVLRIGECSVDEGKQSVIRGDDSVKVQPRDFGVLKLLIEAAPDLVPNQDMLATVWRDKVVVDNVIHQSIGRLRRALGDDPRNPTYIETLAKRGYRLIAPITAMTQTQLRTLQLSPAVVLPFRNHSVDQVDQAAVESLCFEIGRQFLGRGVDVLNSDHQVALPDSRAEFVQAANLGATTLISGSVLVHKQTLRVLVSLSDVATQYKLWSERYDTDVTDTFEIQNLIARTIVEEVCEKFSQRLGPKPAGRDPDNLFVVI